MDVINDDIARPGTRAPAFAARWRPATESRRRITAATRRPEPDCVADLLRDAPPTPDEATALATRLVEALRARGRPRPVEGLMAEYALSSQEGVALMCLAEALLRIPDAATRDAADPRQDRRRRLARASRAQPVAVRQRRHLGPADHRQAAAGDERARRGLQPALARVARPRRRAADPARRWTARCG